MRVGWSRARGGFQRGSWFVKGPIEVGGPYPDQYWLYKDGQRYVDPNIREATYFPSAVAAMVYAEDQE